MKKAGFIIIGLFLTVFVTVHFFIFQLSLNSHQAQFRSGLTNNLSLIEKIEITPSELFTDSKNIKWLDNNKEISINGLLYDVVSILNSGKTVSLFLVNDGAEKTLLDNYSQLAGSIFDNSNPAKPNLIKDFLSLKFFQDSPLEITIPNISRMNVSAGYLLNIITVFLSQETPPPNIFS